MKHRKLARFFSLSAACVVSLGLGAYLSYEASLQVEGGEAQSVGALAPELAPDAGLRPVVALAPASDASETAQQTAPVLKVSLEATREPASSAVFAPADVAAPRMELRPAEAEAAAPDSAPPADEAQKSEPEAPQKLAALPDLPPLPDFGPAVSTSGKPAPLPPRRPSSLSAAVTPSAAAPAGSDGGPAPAAENRGAFPAIADALAAMSANVGGPNGTLAPGAQEAVQPPESATSGNFRKGAPIYVRIFKQEGTLELWMKRGDSYALYKSFPVCKWSGRLGPKTRSADYQSPEGFYSVSARQLNPHSHYHLAFDLGYPNAYDRRQGATGSAVMVHGDCKSVGCFAMTNRGIEEIYGYVAAALAHGQREVPVHVFPFRMTEEAIEREAHGNNFLAFLEEGGPRRDWSSFWRNLKQGYDMFQRSHVPPVAYACGDHYDFGAAGRSCARIAGW